EIISLEQFDPNSDFDIPLRVEYDSLTGLTTRYKRAYIMDGAFNAQCKVLQPVFNDLKTDTINFKVYDHYGRPAFESHKTVLLYISLSLDGTHYIHQKYQYDPLVKYNRHWRGLKRETLSELIKIKWETVFKSRVVSEQ